MEKTPLARGTLQPPRPRYLPLDTPLTLHPLAAHPGKAREKGKERIRAPETDDSFESAEGKKDSIPIDDVTLYENYFEDFRLYHGTF